MAGGRGAGSVLLRPEGPTLGVVIPTLNAAPTLGRCLRALQGEAGGRLEIVVSDGGSSDRTLAVAEASGVRTVQGPPGRGTQLAAGAAATRAGWLLFLHADTILQPGWRAAAGRFISSPENAHRAAYFRFALDDPQPAGRRLERLVALRRRVLGLPYGDQGCCWPARSTSASAATGRCR